jgi:hypothetical protein
MFAMKLFAGTGVNLIPSLNHDFDACRVVSVPTPRPPSPAQEDDGFVLEGQMKVIGEVFRQKLV